jgi:PPOX class probable F420-dependent enzyme
VTELAAFAELLPRDNGLCVLSTLRRDGGIQSSVVNAGVMLHPVTAEDVVGVVVAGDARKLRNLRRDARCTILIRSGWQWVAVDGAAELLGPDDPRPEFDAGALRLLLRTIFQAAGGAHDDWDTFDRVMAGERRAAVLITPRRVYTNPTG